MTPVCMRERHIGTRAAIAVWPTAFSRAVARINGMVPLVYLLQNANSSLIAPKAQPPQQAQAECQQGVDMRNYDISSFDVRDVGCLSTIRHVEHLICNNAVCYAVDGQHSQLRSVLSGHAKLCSLRGRQLHPTQHLLAQIWHRRLGLC